MPVANQRRRPLRQRIRAAAAEAMLDAAEAALIRGGYAATTMQRIAAAAGCAIGTFYLYFRNKEELFQAIVARHAQAMYGIGCRALADAGDPLSRLRGSHAAMLRYTQQHRHFFELFFAALPMRKRGIEQRLSRQTRRHRDQYVRLEQRTLADAQRQGLLRRDLEPELLQEFMDAVCLSMVERFVSSTPPPDFEQQFNVLWGLVTRGIGAEGRSHGGR
jgi:AcrR family transcriptional regulator